MSLKNFVSRFMAGIMATTTSILWVGALILLVVITPGESYPPGSQEVDFIRIVFFFILLTLGVLLGTASLIWWRRAFGFSE